MKNLIIYLFVRLTTRHALTAIKIFETIQKSEPIKPTEPVININNTSTGFTDSGKVKSKKQEIIDTINYLKSKQSKTKTDKESLYSLEMILKNM